jgi:flagellar motor protein MotB
VTRGFGASVPLPGHAPADPANRRVEAELVR